MPETNEINGVAEDDTVDEQQQDKKKKEKKRQHDDGAADLERVTDYAEEKEISAADISNAMQHFGNKLSEQTELKLAKEKELQAVQVKKEDIELLVNELFISRTEAEKVLREQRGDVVEAIELLISANNYYIKTK